MSPPVPYNFTILDTSPLFQYLPSQDGPIDTSWNASFSGSSDSAWVPQSLGVGESSHRTTLAGASVQLDWVGTGIYLFGDASAGGYIIRLDGTQTSAGTATNVPRLLFTQSGLNYGPHSLLLQVIQGTASIANAIITVGMGEIGTTIQNYTITTTTVPLTTNGIVLSGSWLSYVGPYGINGPIVARLATTTNGSSISFPLTSASAFYINGHVNFDHGPYHVTMTPPPDFGSPPVYYNGSSRWVGLNTVKYLATGMNRTRTYQVEVTNDSGLYYDMSQIVVFDTPPSSSQVPNSGPNSLPSGSSSSHPLGAGVIAGAVVAGVFVLFALSIFLFCMYRLRKRQPSRPDELMIQYDSLPAGGAAAPSSSPPALTELPPLLPNAHANLIPDRLRQPQSQAGHVFQSSSTAFEIPNASPLARSVVVETMSPAQRPVVVASGNLLTSEDARFFNNLYSLNVPAADIATMMEAMRAEREADNRMAESSSGALYVQPESAAPPGYDFKA